MGYKEIFVPRGFSHKEGIKYKETLVSVARYTSIRYILVGMRWEIRQLDIKTSFLNGVVEEEVYVEKPLGFKPHNVKTHVQKLIKALYELRRNP